MCWNTSRCAGWVQVWAAVVVVANTVSGLWAGVRDGRLDIYWIDVEGGAATLMVTPAGQTILVDTGNPGPRDPDRIVRTLVEQAGCQKIDFLVITHYHRDHYGGAATLATQVPIDTLYDNGRFDGMPDDPGREYFEFPCRKRIVIQPGMRLPVMQREGSPPLEILCLAARQQFIDPPAGVPENTAICQSHRDKERDGSDNANSIVLLVRFGMFRFLDAGDLTWNLEKRLVCPVNLVGEVDVYQVTHHGLDSSNNPVVLQSIKPTVAVMNNGATKGCMPEVFATLKETPSLEAIYQVHRNVRPDGSVNNTADEYIANDEVACKGEGIVLSVAADATSYEVRVPAKGHRRTFAVRAKP
ncbi:MAG: hypothetical protein KatS3mg110_3940 [Pirellulaceae bacterium]|nr:MAG: hypothetical protein KatS3mg110_3940 [Pirellulaceae bacterium]